LYHHHLLIKKLKYANNIQGMIEVTEVEGRKIGARAAGLVVELRGLKRIFFT